MEECETHVLPNGETVLFYPATHEYVVQGRVVPSVTTLLKKVYGDTYSAVNPELLKKAAEYGTAVHGELQQLIEDRKTNPDLPMFSIYQEVNNYFLFVEPIYKIEPIVTEKVVVLYDEKGKACSAGRFDLLCNVDKVLTLADFKTTSSVHRQLVTAQLNLYMTAAKQSGYLTQDQVDNMKLGVIHLSGSTCKYIPINKLNENFYLNFLK